VKGVTSMRSRVTKPRFGGGPASVPDSDEI
jgi:hypothetical protein